MIERELTEEEKELMWNTYKWRKWVLLTLKQLTADWEKKERRS